MQASGIERNSINNPKGYLSINLFPPESMTYLRDYLCSICNGVYYKPCVTSCGHIFCEECIQSEIKSNGHCPCCPNSTSVGPVMPIYSIENIIGKHPIHCKNVTGGCTWSGNISNLDIHLKSCEKRTVPCPNPGCCASFLKENLEAHLIECEYSSEKCELCGVEFFSKKKKEHNEVCTKIKIQCTLNCGDLIAREEMGNHQNLQCTKKIIDCPFNQVGCAEKVERGRHETHQKESLSKHTFMLLKGFEEIKSRFQKSEEVLYEMKNSANFTSAPIITNSNSISNPTTINSPNEIIDTESKALNKKRLRSDDNPKGESERWAKNSLTTINLNMEDEHNEKSPFEEEFTIDTLDISKGVQVKLNHAKCISSLKTEHKLVMTNNILNDGNYQWKVKINHISGWMGLGACLKEVVISNNLKFSTSKSSFMHGMFVLSSNGFSWNTINSKEDSKKLEKSPPFQNGDEILFRYDHEKGTLLISSSSSMHMVKLTNISFPKNNTLVPCVLFLSENDEITFAEIKRLK